MRNYVLDGDNIRTGLNKDLGLSPEDRKENVRRIAEVAKLMVDSGLLVFAAFIAPYKQSREYVRKLMAGWTYYEGRALNNCSDLGLYSFRQFFQNW